MNYISGLFALFENIQDTEKKLTDNQKMIASPFIN